MTPERSPNPLLILILIWALLAAGLLLPLSRAAAQGPETDFVDLIRTDDVMGHIRALSVAIGARPAGTAAEGQAADYVAAALADYGYTVEVQEFQTESYVSEAADSVPISSQNVVGIRQGDEQVIVIGAHLDSVDIGTGADDNASGVAVMLAAAEALAQIDTTHTLVFVGFGAEETGDPTGSDIFVENLGEDTANVIAMINIDTVGVGPMVNVYAGAVIEWGESDEEAPLITGGSLEVRDLALELADAMGYDFGTTPDSTWGGYTGDWSDHYAFVEAGIPVAYFEAWDWFAGDDPWLGQETAEGDVLHSEDDVYEAIIPENVEMAAEVVAATVAALAE